MSDPSNLSAELDLSAVTPEQFATLVREVPEDDLAGGIRAVGTGEVLARVFDGMQERFRPDRAGGTDATIQWVVRDEGEEYPYIARVTGGTCEITPGRADGPTVQLSVDLLPFLKLITGQDNGPALFMRGKLQLSGDIMLASRLTTFFDQPTPA